MNFRKKMKAGGGEVLTFLATLPCLMVILVFLVGTFEVGRIKERMEYTTYMACRAAVVEKNYNKALEAAKKAAEEDLTKSGEKHIANMKVDLQVLSKDEDGDGHEWKKGNMVQCIITTDLKKIPIMFQQKKIFTLTMMIEYPATEEDGETYWWFRDYEKAISSDPGLIKY